MPQGISGRAGRSLLPGCRCKQTLQIARSAVVGSKHPTCWVHVSTFGRVSSFNHTSHHCAERVFVVGLLSQYCFRVEWPDKYAPSQGATVELGFETLTEAQVTVWTGSATAA